MVLDIGGLVPVVGEVADGVNAGIYLVEGDKLNAGLSAAAMIPIAGWGATGAKVGVKAEHAVEAGRAADHAVEAGRAADHAAGAAHSGNVVHSVDGVGGNPDKVQGVGGARDDAAYGERNPNPPGSPENPFKEPGPSGPLDDAATGQGLRKPSPHDGAQPGNPSPFAWPFGRRPQFPTIFIPRPAGGMA
jgi:hypothetical protein